MESMSKAILYLLLGLGGIFGAYYLYVKFKESKTGAFPARSSVNNGGPMPQYQRRFYN